MVTRLTVLVGLVVLAGGVARGKDAPATATRPAGKAPASQPAAVQAKPLTRIVFVIDASGSMASKLEDDEEELGKGVTGLTPDQSFDLIAFQENKVIKFSKTLLPATEENKAKAWAFLCDMTVTGTGDPAAAFNEAAKLNPSLVWFVSDGDVTNGKRALTVAERVARAGRFHINTVLRFSDDDESDGYLQDLSQRTGGVCLGRDGNPAQKPIEGKPAERSPPPKGPSIFDEK
jgi:hypothetical protein